MRIRARNPFRRRLGPLECAQVGELLQQYLDECVDDELARRIAEHLDDCRRCGLEADTYRRIKASLAARRPEVPRDSLERLRAFGERLAGIEQPSGS